MSDKYLLMSEAEFDAAIDAALNWGECYAEEYYPRKRLQDAMDACRARPFEKYQAVVEAGQAMREARIAEHYLEHNKYELGCKKWDAATKEDV